MQVYEAFQQISQMLLTMVATFLGVQFVCVFRKFMWTWATHLNFVEQPFEIVNAHCVDLPGEIYHRYNPESD